MKGRSQLIMAGLVAAIGLATPTAAAVGRGARNAGQTWQPPQKTAAPAVADDLGYVPQAALYDGTAPSNAPLTGSQPPAPTAAPTSPFDHFGRLLARDTLDVCGYVDAEYTSSIYCNAGYECVVNSINFVVGCCPTTSTNCPVQTSCVASSNFSLASTGTDPYVLYWFVLPSPSISHRLSTANVRQHKCRELRVHHLRIYRRRLLRLFCVWLCYICYREADPISRLRLIDIVVLFVLYVLYILIFFVIFLVVVHYLVRYCDHLICR